MSALSPHIVASFFFLFFYLFHLGFFLYHSKSPSFTQSLIQLLIHFLSVSVHTPTSSFFHIQTDITSSMKCWPLNSLWDWSLSADWPVLPRSLPSCHVKCVAILGVNIRMSIYGFQHMSNFIRPVCHLTAEQFQALFWSCMSGKPLPSDNMKRKQIPHIFHHYISSSVIQSENHFNPWTSWGAKWPSYHPIKIHLMPLMEIF